VFDAPQAVEIFKDALRPDTARRPPGGGRVKGEEPKASLDATEHGGAPPSDRSA
jgi:hypothetical protein